MSHADMLQDLRFAVRSFRKSPGFTLIAVLVLALGVGANTAIFSVVDAVLLRALPFRDPARLVMVWEANPALGGFLAERLPVALKNYLAWQAQSRSFISISVFKDDAVSLLGGDKPERIQAGLASSSFFGVLGVAAHLGRTFSESEGDRGDARVVVLTDGLYKRRFGSNPRILGTTVTLSGKDHTVIGVLPAGFHLPAFWEGMDQKKPELWVPLNTAPNQPEDRLVERQGFVFARLKPGVSLNQARAEMKVIANGLQLQLPDLDKGFSASIFPLAVEDVGPSLRQNVLVLQFAVGFVLLIACANVANLLLTRASGREKELAIRMALGAGRHRIIRQMLSESLLLSIAGGACGLVLGYWAIRFIETVAPADIHNLHEMQMDPLVLGFTLVLVLLTAVVFGLAPSLHAASQNVNASLGHGGRAGIGGQSKLKGLLVISEVALALILLIGAGLMIRSVRALMAVDPGFKAVGLLKMQIALSPPKYPKPDDARTFGRRLTEAVEALPGVRAVAIAGGLPMQNIRLTSFDIEGAPPAAESARPRSDYQFVTENYFQTKGSRIVRGRTFTRAEAEESEPRVIVISESLAKQYWSGQDPIGRAILVPQGHGKKIRLGIIGIAADTHQMGLDTASRPELYRPSRSFNDFSLVVRCAGNPMQFAPTITKQVYAIDKDQPVTDITTMDEIVRGSGDDRRFTMTMLSVFSGLALVLASVGLYGVLAYSVAQRRREIGIRMALGAKAEDVVRLVVGQGLWLTLIGIGIGLAGAFALTRLMESLIFGVSAADPATFGLISAGLTAVALVASYLPARRAAKIDPMEALRTE